jgi:hypothetical protein
VDNHVAIRVVVTSLVLDAGDALADIVSDPLLHAREVIASLESLMGSPIALMPVGYCFVCLFDDPDYLASRYIDLAIVSNILIPCDMYLGFEKLAF